MANFNPRAGEAMAMASAKQWTARYQAEERRRTGKPDPVKAHAFGADKIRALLEGGAAGIRIYPGLDEEGNSHMILVGIDSDGNDIVSSATSDPTQPSSELLQYGVSCPPICNSSGSSL